MSVLLCLSSFNGSGPHAVHRHLFLHSHSFLPMTRAMDYIGLRVIVGSGAEGGEGGEMMQRESFQAPYMIILATS